MSKKVIDEKVVSLQFDNAKFESNVKTSMSTIDKLKEKLSFKGAEKGFESVSTASNKFFKKSQSEFDSYKSGIFSITDAWNKMWSVMEYTVAYKMKNVLKQFTIAPITSGLQEYETQLNAVQTILANTESKGSTLNDVNAALDELNKYADLTIYNFTEMTRNIGTFTAAGVGLEESVSAIKGIANLAAVSGSTPQQAATAMYQLSQALSSGTVRLMDWNSVVNAGMGGEVFQNALKETARVHGVAIDDIIKKEGSFRESLSNGWLSSEILTETLEHFTMAAEEGSKEWEEFKKQLKSDGYTEEQADAILKMANTATEAATKVKTFSQLIDVSKEALQSGWAQTFEILIGDFEEAKELWTSASDVITGFIGKMSDARNKLLESAFGKGITEIVDGFDSLMETVGNVTEPIDKAVESLEDFDEIVSKVIRGDFGNGRTRYSKLTEAGWNYYKVQNKVNETLGDTYRYTEEQIAKQEELINGTKKSTEAKEEEKKETIKLTDEQKNELKLLASMTEEQLRSKGYTEEQIQALKNLGETAKKLGMPINEFIDNLDKINGRFLWVNSFKNIGNSIIAIFKSIGKAWTEIFDPITGDQLFNGLAGFHRVTANMLDYLTKHGDELTRIFKGLFAAVDIVVSLFGSAFKLAIQAANAVLSAFGTDVLSLIAWLADGIVWVRNWIDAHNPIIWLFTKLGELLKWATDRFKGWLNSFKDPDTSIGEFIIEGLINGITSGIKKLIAKAKEIATTVIDTVKEWLGIHSPSTVFMAIGGFIVLGLVLGIENAFSLITSIGKKLFNLVVDIFKGFEGIWNWGKTKLQNVWTIISDCFKKPDGDKTKENIEQVKTWLDTTKEFFSSAWQGIVNIWNKITGWVKKVDWNAVTSVLMSGGLIYFLVRLSTLVGLLSKPIKSLADLIGEIPDFLDIIGDVTRGFGRTLKSISFKFLSDGMFKFAASIAILAGTIILLGYAFERMDTAKAWEALGMVAVLSAIVAGLMIAINLTSKSGLNITGMSLTLTGLAILLLSLAGCIAIVSSIDYGKAWSSLGIIALFMLEIIVIVGLAAKIAPKAGKLAGTFLMLGAALLMLAWAMRIIGNIGDEANPEAFSKATHVVGIFVSMLAGMTAIMAFGKQNLAKVGSIFFGIGVALLGVAWAMKTIGDMDWKDIAKGAAVITGVMGLMMLMIVVSKDTLTDKKLRGLNASTAKMGAVFMSMGVAFIAIAWAMKIIGGMETSEVIQASIVIGAIMGLMIAMIALSKDVLTDNKLKEVGSNISKIGVMFMGIGVALLAAALAIKILSTMNWKEDWPAAVAAIVILGVFLGMAAALAAIAKKINKDIPKLAGTFMGIGVALLAAALAIAILTMLDTKKAWHATGMLVLLMGGLALVALGARGVVEAKGTFFALAACIAVLAVAVGVLSLIDPLKLVNSTAAIFFVLLSFAAVMKSLENVKMEKGQKTWVLLLTVIGVIVAIGAALWLLSGRDWESILASMGAMSLTLLALVAAIKILEKTNINIAKMGQALIAVGILALIMAGLAGVLYLTKDIDPLQALAMTGVLSVFVLAMTGIAAILGLAAPILGPAVAGAALLVAIIAILVVGIAAIGIATVGIIVGIAAMLPGIGSNLSEFSTNVQPFLDSMRALDSKVLAGVGILALILTLLAAGTLVECLAFIASGILALIGHNLKSFGESMTPFCNAMKQVTPDVVTNAKAIADVIGVLGTSSFATAIDNAVSAIVKFFSGKTPLATKLLDFADAAIAFSNKISGKIDTSAVNAVSNLALGLGALKKIKSSDIKDAVKSIKELNTLATSMNDVDYTGMSAFGKSLETVAETGITLFVSTFMNSVDEATTAVNSFIEAMIANLDAGYAGYAGFAQSGAYVGEGFVSGVESKWQDAYDAGYSIGRAAMQGTKDATDQNSPSKEFYKLGAFSGLGFVNAFIDYESASFAAGSDLADSAINGLSNALSHVQDVIDSDMDVQPTIRPVLDLSDVRSGAGQINGLLNANPSVGVEANLSAIKRLSQNNQNGANDDVVSAILELGNMLDKMSGDTYNINGITYDDGSNIANAVGSIVREARMARRI